MSKTIASKDSFIVRQMAFERLMTRAFQHALMHIGLRRDASISDLSVSLIGEGRDSHRRFLLCLLEDYGAMKDGERDLFVNDYLRFADVNPFWWMEYYGVKTYKRKSVAMLRFLERRYHALFKL